MKIPDSFFRNACNLRFSVLTCFSSWKFKVYSSSFFVHANKGNVLMRVMLMNDCDDDDEVANFMKSNGILSESLFEIFGEILQILSE